MMYLEGIKGFFKKPESSTKEILNELWSEKLELAEASWMLVIVILLAHASKMSGWLNGHREDSVPY